MALESSRIFKSCPVRDGDTAPPLAFVCSLARRNRNRFVWKYRRSRHSTVSRQIPRKIPPRSFLQSIRIRFRSPSCFSERWVDWRSAHLSVPVGLLRAQNAHDSHVERLSELVRIIMASKLTEAGSSSGSRPGGVGNARPAVDVRCVVHNFADDDDDDVDVESTIRSLFEPELVVLHCQPSTTGLTNYFSGVELSTCMHTAAYSRHMKDPRRKIQWLLYTEKSCTLWKLLVRGVGLFQCLARPRPYTHSPDIRDVM